jgi:cytochrome P450
MTAIPRFTGPPLLGLNLRFLRDPIGMFMQAHRECGDLVELDLGVAGSVYAAFHPDGVKQTLLHGRRTHRQLLRELLGKGLFTTPSGDDWKRRRRLLQPLFREDRLVEMAPLLLRPVDEALQRRWRPGCRVDLAAEMKAITIAMMVDATFGIRTGIDRATVREALGFLLGYVDKRLFTFVKPPLSWPTQANRRYRRDIAAVRALVGEAVRARRRNPVTEPTFLNGLLDSQGRDGTPKFTDEELVDEVLSIFIAGTETTGTALTWALHLLSTHPVVAGQLQQEVAATLTDSTPTTTHLRELSLPRAVVSEALRLYPPAWALRRVIDEPLEIGSALLPAGARLIVSSYVTHRHNAVWPSPELFNPERWLGTQTPPRFAYFPFGAGAHQCAGNAFALLEGELILSRMAQRFRLNSVPGRPIGTRPAIALAPVPSPTPMVVAT